MRRLRSFGSAPVPCLVWTLAAGCSSGGHAAASPDGGATASTGPSCSVSASSTCGSGSCCEARVVPSGSFFRSYDGISTNGATKQYASTVSSFALDRYEVTVGRFRAFVAAEVAGWRPTAGAGKHAHLPAGGLVDATGALEGGWNSAWTNRLATSVTGWTTNLSCDPSLATWSVSPSATDDHPINCVDWYEAYAFCIWDGGFLPSEAEWNYAAAGGADQRVYPWSLPYPPGSTTLDCQHADYTTSSAACGSTGTVAVGSFSPLGDGKWGHADLAGNVFEWTLDSYEATYASASCDDCADLAAKNDQVIRGGAFEGSAACLLNSLREDSVPTGRSESIGVRCARPPTP